VIADSISYTPCRIEKTLLLPQLTNMSTSLKQGTWPCSFLQVTIKIQFNIAIRNNFVVIESLSHFQPSLDICQVLHLFKLWYLFYKILHNKHNVAHNLAQWASVNMCLVSHTRALMFLGKLWNWLWSLILWQNSQDFKSYKSLLVICICNK